DDDFADPRIALHQGVDPGESHRAHLFSMEFPADARRMTPYQVDLEAFEFVFGDPFGDELAEAGVQSIDGLAAFDHFFDALSGFPDGFARVVGDPDFRILAGDRSHVLGRERFAVEDDRFVVTHACPRYGFVLGAAASRRRHTKSDCPLANRYRGDSVRVFVGA